MVKALTGPPESPDIPADNTRTAFGELSVAELTPQVQMQWPYNINSRITESRANQSGSVDHANNMARLQTGAAANSSGCVLSVKRPVYAPGQGILARFTPLFTAGATGSTQWVGVGDAADGLFFGFEGTGFGLMVRRGGQTEIRTLTVTVASDTAEDITITLDGDAKTDVAVTNAAITVTANEIAAADYSDVGRGWSAFAVGVTVVFVSWNAEPRTGTYDITDVAGTADGTFAQIVAGVVPTETFIPQDSWNADVANGSAVLPLLDPTKGNVYQIRYQWLGFGALDFSIEDPVTGDLVLVHRVRYANANTEPSINNPSLPLSAIAENVANTSNLTVQIGSMSGLTEGERALLGPVSAVSAVNTNINTTTETPVITLHNKIDYQGHTNRTVTLLGTIAVATDATQSMAIIVRYNATLVGAVFADVDADNSAIEVDSTATGVSGGTLGPRIVVSKNGQTRLLLSIDLLPGETVTISGLATLGTGHEALVSVEWNEEF